MKDIDYRKELLDVANRFCTLTGKARGTIGNAVAKDARFFDRIEEGGGCTVDTYQNVMRWFDENMPLGK